MNVAVRQLVRKTAESAMSAVYFIGPIQFKLLEPSLAETVACANLNF